MNCEGSENGSEDDQRHGMAFTPRTTNEARTLHTAERQLRGNMKVVKERSKIMHGVEVSMEELFVHCLSHYMN